jgi:uncharacterized protein (DUF305 family)
MKNTFIISLISLAIGLSTGYFIWGTTTPAPQMDMSHTMSGMMLGLQGKTGDAFDKEFITEMVVHHQGAVDMAQAALTNGQHQEIKTLANAIITAQNKEIAEMKAWYKAWYGVNLK